MGRDCPPLYGIDTIIQKMNEILKLDEKINELFIEREMKLEELKKSIAQQNKDKNKA